MTKKTALVTGATRGIGAAVLEALVRSGRRVIACARDVERLAALEKAYPGDVVSLAADLAQVDDTSRVAAQALAHGPVDELVCAAGIVRYASVGEVSEADLRAQLEVNFVSPFLLAQSLGAAMRARGEGSIVFITSTLASVPAPQTSAYASSKAALTQAARALALELAPSVRVNAVAPGVVDTDMIRVPRTKGEDDARERIVVSQLDALAKLHPLQRLGCPADVAQAVCFVLDASWMTGSVLTIDGGLLCR